MLKCSHILLFFDRFYSSFFLFSIFYLRSFCASLKPTKDLGLLFENRTQPGANSIRGVTLSLQSVNGMFSSGNEARHERYRCNFQLFSYSLECTV